MDLSNQKIEEKIAEYEAKLNALPSEESAYKREYVNFAVRKLKQKFQRWKDRQLEDRVIQKWLDKIDDWLNGFEFIDRIWELKQIIDYGSPPVYQIISAPMGYGKSRLLEIARLRLEGDKDKKWHCIHLSLSRGHYYSIGQFTLELLQELMPPGDDPAASETDLDDVAQCGRRLGISLVNYLATAMQQGDAATEKICILIDQAEVLDCPRHKENTLVKSVFEALLPAMSKVVRDYNRKIKWRFIFAGRYISAWENVINRNIIPLKTYELELFEPETIAETIFKYAKEKNKSLEKDVIRQIASLTLHFSGGHPKCMVSIIKDGLAMLLEDVRANEGRYYTDNLLPVVDDIKSHIPSLYDTFETLSVVRKITRKLLDDFIRKEIITGFRSKFTVEEKLLSTFLVQRKEHFLEDAIIRRVLAIHLRRSDAPRFNSLCRQAITSYQEELEDPQSLKPAMLAVELLFLELQVIAMQVQQDDSPAERFGHRLAGLLDTIVDKRSRHALDIIEGICDLLARDSEFELNLYYLLGAQMTDYLKPIEEKISDLKA